MQQTIFRLILWLETTNQRGFYLLYDYAQLIELIPDVKEACNCDIDFPSPRREIGGGARSGLELTTNLREVFTITEKAPRREIGTPAQDTMLC